MAICGYLGRHQSEIPASYGRMRCGICQEPATCNPRRFNAEPARRPAPAQSIPGGGDVEDRNVIRVFVSLEELTVIDELAERERCSRGELLRRVVLRHVEEMAGVVEPVGPVSRGRVRSG